MFRTNVVEEIKTHFTFNNHFFENRALYEKTWENIQITIWRKCFACWIPKATKSHST